MRFRRWQLYYIFQGLLVVGFFRGCCSSTNEFELRRVLFANYSKTHPYASQKPVYVTFGLALLNIQDMDVKKEELGLTIWARIRWVDPRLSWDPTKYGNITHINLHLRTIWHPDIVVYYTTGKIRQFGTNIKGSLEFGVRAEHTGQLGFSQPTSISVICQSTIADYPLDTQICPITAGSWTRSTKAIYLKQVNPPFDLGQYDKHNIWQLSMPKAKIIVVPFSCCPYPYSLIQFELVLRRQPLFYIINYILPAINIACLSLLVFMIPPAVGKKMEAGINLLLCLTVYLLLINSKMPGTSLSFPLLTKFYGCTIFILVVSLCCACAVYAFYFMNPSGWNIYPMSPVTQKIIFEWIGPLLRYNSRYRKSRVAPSSNDIIRTALHREPRPGSPHGGHTGLPVNQGVKSRQNTLGKGIVTRGNSNANNGIENNGIDQDDYVSERMVLPGEPDPGDSEQYFSGGAAMFKGNKNPVRVTSKIPQPTHNDLETAEEQCFQYLVNSSVRERQKQDNYELWKTAALILNRLFTLLLLVSVAVSFVACFMLLPRAT